MAIKRVYCSILSPTRLLAGRVRSVSSKYKLPHLIDSANRIRLRNSCRYPNVSLPVAAFAKLIKSL